MLLSDIVSAYMANSPTMILDTPAVTKHLKRAVRHYAGLAVIASLPPIPVEDGGDGIHSPVSALNEIDEDFDLSLSEYTIIKPLFDLYVEEEQAHHLEASRALGVDTYGRSVSEIKAAILEMETVTIPMLAFCGDAETV